MRYLNRVLMFVIALAVGLVLAYYIDPHRRILIGQNDFTGLYLGGTLAGTPALYTAAPQYEAQQKMFGSVMQAVLFSRPPFYAWLLKPLSMLPYLTAYALFQAVSLGVFVWFLWWAARRYHEILLLAPMFPPAVAVFCTGQDVGIAMGLALASFFAARSGRDLLSGLILSLCAIKLHLFVLLPLAVLLNRRYLILLGGVIGGAALSALSLAGNSTAVVANYLALLRNPVIHPAIDIMPNVRGVANTFGGGPALEIVLAAAVTGVAGWLIWKSHDYETAFAYALIGGLLVNVHCYMPDCILILPALVILAEKGASKPAMALLMLAATPIPAIALQNGSPASLLLPLLLFGTLVAGAISQRGPGAQPDRLPSEPVSSPAH